MIVRPQSFKFAFRGLFTLVKTQPNARIHLLATIAVIIIGLLLHLSAAEWCWLVLAMIAVWVAEAFNTAVEQLADVVSPNFHPAIARAKDLAAAGVLIAALGAAVIGALVLGRHFL
jgi:diacylglycerol kinase (ATP)